MELGFVLTVDKGRPGELSWESKLAFEVVTGAQEELAARLRPWALQILRRDDVGNGHYFARLVALDEDRDYDPYLAEEVEDILWFYGVEHVPVVGSAASSDLV
jgi:hypothetical protein